MEKRLSHRLNNHLNHRLQRAIALAMAVQFFPAIGLFPSQAAARPERDPPMVENAKVLIRTKKDQSAATMLRDFLQSNPRQGQAKAHYLLGACLYHQRSFREAQAEFQTALKLSNDPHLQKAGREALQAVGDVMAQMAQQPHPHVHFARIEFSDEESAALQRISEAVEEKALLEEDEFARRADRVLQDAHDQAKKLRDEEDGIINDLRHTRGGGSRIGAVQDEYENKIEFIERRAMAHAKDIMEQGRRRRKAIEEAAIGARDERISAPGTNFYVHNYHALRGPDSKGKSGSSK